MRTLILKNCEILSFLVGSNSRKHRKDSQKQVSFTSENRVSSNLKFLEEIHDGAQLLVSCLHSWGLDPEIDDICTAKLGLLKPVKPVLFGLLTHRKLSLIMPGWYSHAARSSACAQNLPGGKLRKIYIE